MTNKQLILLFLIFSFFSTQAQFSGTNLTEYQYGKLATQNEDEFHSVYNKLMLNYGYKAFKFSVGAQAYATPYDERNYIDPSWISVSFKQKGWELKAGNFNETLGRGLLIRSYEIPGALLEDKGFRSKNYFYRDLLGASAGYKNTRGEVKAFWGYAYNNVFPPSQDWEQRRSDEVAAVSGAYKILKQTLGASAMRLSNDAAESYYGMAELSGSIVKQLSYHVAYAFRATTDETLTDNDEEAYALYSSLNFSADKLGVSLELKDYRNFLIGSGINEPPALIKEHTYKTLNRATHVLLPSYERGIQAEAFYQFNLWTVLTLNYTLARNKLLEEVDYHEWFAEISTSLGDAIELKAFADFAKDPFNSIDDRISLGTTIDYSFPKGYGLKLDTEWQQFDRSGENVQNVVAGLTFRRKSKLFLGIISELSNDSFLTEDDMKLWLGGTARYKLNSKHNFTLFVGERRGGPACNAGVCYELLDFKGVEVRWNARF